VTGSARIHIFKWKSSTLPPKHEKSPVRG